MEKKRFQILKFLFVALFVLVSAAPFILMPWFGNQEAESDDANAAIAPLVIDGKLNKSFFLDEYGKFNGKIFEETGDWFSKKFAFRREMVDAGDRIRADVFGVSGQSGVTVGKDGYLFYTDSFDDFLGRDQLSDYEIYSLEHNIKLMQETLDLRGIDFLFTIAPNKNSLYPDLMPDRYDPDIDNRNAERLIRLLEKDEVNYADLYSVFRRKDDFDRRVHYHRGDSHWTNEGAKMVADKLMSALGRGTRPHGSETNGGKTVKRDDFKGDLYKMLYPATNETDPEFYDSDMEPKVLAKRLKVKIPDMSKMGMLSKIDITKETEWSESEEIETVNKKGGQGSLLMIRDSFGNSLAPYIADEFKRATFLNNSPYDIGRAITDKRKTVIFEIVERNLDRLLNDAAVIPAVDDFDAKEKPKMLTEKYNGTLSAEISDMQMGYIHITGTTDPERFRMSSVYYVEMKDSDTGKVRRFRCYRTRRPAGDQDPISPEEQAALPYGVSAYVAEDDLPEGSYGLRLVYNDHDGWHRTKALGTFDYEKEDI